VVADFMGSVNFVPALVRDVAHGAGTVDAGGFLLRVELPGDAREGDRVEVAVRPENMHLASPGEVAPGSVKAVVEEQSYLGNLNEYVVALGDLRLRVQGDSQAEFSPGAEALLSIDERECNVFPVEKDLQR